MFRFLTAVLLEVQLTFLAASLTVDVLQPHYSAKRGDNVTMGCRFPIADPFHLMALNVLWQKKTLRPPEAKEVYLLSRGKEDLVRQHRDYQGRAVMLLEGLERGHSMLHITNVKITDAGMYICLIQYEKDADYKYITLEVQAPYKKIDLQEQREDNNLVLTCESEGYPLAEVSWYDENNQNVSMFAVTTQKLTTDGVFNITSTLRVKSNIPGNYTCVFWNKELKEKTSVHASVSGLVTTNEPETEEKYLISFILPICLLALCFLMILIFRTVKRKRFTDRCIQKGKRRKPGTLTRRNLDHQAKELKMMPITD
nr:programmed cell death 1 ligand 2 [Pogona vitticeps]